MKFIIEIYFPIVFDYNFESYPFKNKDIIIEEIQSVLKLNKINYESHILQYSACVEIEKYNPGIITQNLSNPHFSSLKEDTLKFTFSTDVDVNKFKVTHHDGDKVT